MTQTLKFNDLLRPRFPMNPTDLASDCTPLDGAESVSVTLRQPEGTTVLTLDHALRRVLRRQAGNFDGVALQGDEVTWHLLQSELGAGIEPQPGDTIAAGEQVWAIVSLEQEALGTRWRCHCRRQPGR